MSKFGIIIIFVVALLTIPLYIYTYKYGMSAFWIIFILDRIVSLILELKFSRNFDISNFKINDGDKFTTSKFIIMIILLTVVGVGMIIYISFKYPKLFIVLMVGKAIDKVIGKISKIKLC